MHRQDDTKKTAIVIIAMIVIIFIAIATFRGARAISERSEPAETDQEILIKKPLVEFAVVDVDAISAIVYDINAQEVLYAKNEYEKRPLASVTKLMTIYAADMLLKDSSQSVTFSPYAIDTYGEYGFYVGETWDRDVLQDYTLITSSNDGAVALAESAGATITPSVDSATRVASFVSYMNTLATNMGLRSTTFDNPTGLDLNDTAPQAFGSASDISALLSKVITENPSALEASSLKRKTFNQGQKKYIADNTNSIVGTIPGLIVSKTGYTDAAGGNLAVVYDSGLNRPISIVVLGSTKEGRFTDMTRLIEHTQDYFSRKAELENVFNDLAE